MTMSFEVIFSAGSTIAGKWRKNRYRVERLLGEGANGKVFLVSKEKNFYALKVGFDSVDLQLEVNMLRALEKSGGLDAFLVDADDFSLKDQTYPFYVMRYVRGSHVQQFIKQRGTDWIFPIGLNVLKKLCRLHEKGWIFGDLKADNLIVAEYGNVELVDFGGVTAIGRSVRQFTEIYDRGYWNAGTRVADGAYDLFAFAILCLELTDAQHRMRSAEQLLPQNRNVQFLLELVSQTSMLDPIAVFLQKAILGQYANSTEACRAWKTCSLHSNVGSKPLMLPDRWIQVAFLLSTVLFGSSLYVLFK